MKIIKNVHGSFESSRPIIVGKTTVYEHSNIEQLKDENGKLIDMYVYDEIQYDKDEYLTLIGEKNIELKAKLNELNTRLLDSEEMLNTILFPDDIEEDIEGGSIDAKE